MTGNVQQARLGRTREGSNERLATALGWFGIGLGLAELAAPRTMARMIGVEDGARTDRVLRGFGVREIASGIGIVASGGATTWLWSRVAGDLMDLAFLGGQYTQRPSSKPRVATTTAAVAAVTVLDVLASRRATDGTSASQVPARPAVVTINRAPEEIYRFWRRLENLPLFMTHLRSVEETGDRTSHWVVEALGTTLAWDAEIVEDLPSRRIAWRALESADVPNEGAVTFAPGPGDRGTEVRVEMSYAPPAGRVGKLFAELLGSDPGQTSQQELRRLKQILETGEVATTEGQPHGPRGAVSAMLEPFELRSQS